MPRRIRRPSSKDELLNQLTDKERSGIFDTYKDAILFAATVGAYNNQSKEFDKSSEPIDYNIFSKRADNEALIHLLAIYKTNDIDILSEDRSDERVLILEEYANAGLDIIETKIRKSTTALDAILDLIHSINQGAKSDDRRFDDLVKLFQE